VTIADNDNPWDRLQPHDSARFGEVIHDPVERARWCRAVLTGGLPLIWRGPRIDVSEDGAAAGRQRVGDRRKH
jgi:hypothetical protein